MWSLLIAVVINCKYIVRTRKIIHFLDCVTVSGKTPNLPCIFPFKYENSIRETCTVTIENGVVVKPWCSTKVDKNGYHIEGNWGDCASNCPQSCHVKELSTEKLKPCIFPYGRVINEKTIFFDECSDLNIENPTGQIMCPTEVDPSTGIMIDEFRTWGLCEKEYCPTSRGMIFFCEEK